MRRTGSLLALFACLGLGSHAAEGAHQEKCDPGTFVVAGRPLLPNPDFEPPDRLVLRDGTLSIASGCPPASVEFLDTRRGTWLRARWAECSGVARRVELRARVGPGCEALAGRLRSASPPIRRRFAATRAVEVCRSACDCYARFELRDDCPLMCPNCGSFWTCEDGQCVENCGFIPIPPCETLCTSNDDCAAEDLCRKPPGACDGLGSCEPRPQACPEVYFPVCGCDGHTYGNVCEAAAAGASLAHRGPCAQRCGTIVGLPCDEGQFCELPPGSCGGADLEGVCVDVPGGCITLWDPVCGCDGRTYGNDCERRGAQVTLAHTGSCEEGTPCGPELVCDGAREVCVAREPVGPAIVYTCEPVPEGCEGERACGCAGKALCQAPFDDCRELGDNALSCECTECQ
jgi:hypothetical protein